MVRLSGQGCPRRGREDSWLGRARLGAGGGFRDERALRLRGKKWEVGRGGDGNPRPEHVTLLVMMFTAMVWIKSCCSSHGTNLTA